MDGATKRYGLEVKKMIGYPETYHQRCPNLPSDCEYRKVAFTALAYAPKAYIEPAMAIPRHPTVKVKYLNTVSFIVIVRPSSLSSTSKLSNRL